MSNIPGHNGCVDFDAKRETPTGANPVEKNPYGQNRAARREQRAAANAEKRAVKKAQQKIVADAQRKAARIAARSAAEAKAAAEKLKQE